MDQRSLGIFDLWHCAIFYLRACRAASSMKYIRPPRTTHALKSIEIVFIPADFIYPLYTFIMSAIYFLYIRYKCSLDLL
ncbi:hypothetical protein WBG78_30205 [Chryseolinea sp. T2]|uniref:hypothetical protein n=1 Tax=Chryseolinea sp. T2 TaxID=3129255 RepID=UPI00307732C4